MKVGIPSKKQPVRKRSFQRLQLEILPQRLVDVERMMEMTGIQTYKQLLEYAVTLFEWSVELTAGGCVVGSLDKKTNAFQKLYFPPLRNIEHQVSTNGCRVALIKETIVKP